MRRKVFLITTLLTFGLINLSFASMPVFKDGGSYLQSYELDIGWNATPAQLDWDRDGLRDLVVGDKEGYVWFFRNTGTEFNPAFNTGVQVQFAANQQPINVGKFATPFVIDFDNNGLLDLIVGNEYGTITRFPMQANPPFVDTPTEISLANQTLRGVHFITPTTGWIVGDNGVIFYTIDAGNTWLPQQSNTNKNINSVYFLDSDNGWAVGNDGLILHYKRENDIPTWQVSYGTPTNLHSVFFFDANNGWAVGDRGTILHYANGSWTTRASGVTTDLHSVCFRDAATGWIVGEKIDAENRTILETTDGGLTWAPVPNIPVAVPIIDYYAITRPPGTNHWWLVGANGTIVQYDGVAWNNITPIVNTNLYSVHFIDQNNGWAVGANGTILQYNNGNWTSGNAGVTSNLYSVFIKDNTHAWAVGDNTTIRFYNGTDWNTQQSLDMDIGYNSAPFIFDLDEDGKKDLLIGDDPGNVWFFKNNGSDDNPTFGYGFRMNIGSQAVTGTSSNFIDVGQFAMPQVADWNGDGTKDLIIGNGEGNVFLFKGVVTSGTNTQGLIPLIGNRILTFEPGQKIKVDNLDIDVGQRAAPLVMDWNKDCGLDLLVGVECGSIHVFLNDYPYQPPQFSFSSKVQGPPTPLQIGLYSTPAVIDWDDDHRKDLLVGDEDGFVTLFLNSGTDKEPKLSGGFKLKVYGTSTEKGTFTEDLDAGKFSRPFPVDWNNDYKKDIIVGNMTGEVFYFRNIKDDKTPLFAPGIKITAGSPSSTLDVGEYATPVVVDWDTDGKKDLVVGNKEGNVLLYLNTGRDDAPVFGSPTKLTTPSSEIDVGDFAVPFVVDYNGDHKKDLVVGDFDGFITVFLNIGTDKVPILDEGRRIRIEGEGDIDVGKHAAPWVVDYDNSCSLDIVVGHKEGFVNLFISSGIVELYITKSVDKTYASLQDILTYTIEYGNRGNFNASNVEITDDIPALTQLVEPAQGESIDTILYATNTNGVWTEIFSTQATRIKWIRNELLQGNIGQKVGFKVRVLNTGDITNYATIKSDQTYLQMSNTVTTTSGIIGVPDFSTSEKSVYPEGEVLPGSILTFTIKYKNTGNDIATNVVITDIIDPNLCNITNISNNGVYSNGRITWNLGTILVDGGGEVRFEATVFSPLPGGVVIRNSATITAFPLFAWQTNEVVVTIPVLDSESDDWPMFHFNLAHEGYDFREIIRTPLELKWTAKPSNKILSSPIVADDRVYIASFDNKIYTFDAQSGSLIGSFATTSEIDSTPAVVKDRLYGADSNGNVFCWSTNPEFKWSYGLGGDVRYSSVAVDDAKLYIGCGKNLSALNASKPELLWTYPTAGEIQSSPAIANGRVYFGSGDGNLYCLTTSGEFKWRFGTVGAIFSSPAVKDGVVYVGSDDNYIYAIDAYSGTKKWGYKTNDKVRSSPAIANQVIFCGANDGHLYAINEDGNLKWAHLIGTKIESSPAVANGVVYFGANDGYVYGLDVDIGTELWKYYTGPNKIYSSPAIVEGILYIASSDGTLYAFTSHADFSNSNLNKKLNSPIGTVKAGDEITYTIKFYNEGLGQAINFKIKDTLNQYLQFISASNNGTYSSGVVTWDIGTIGANSGGSVILRVKVGTNTPNDTLIDNIATFTWDTNSKDTNKVTNRIIKEIITLLKVVNIQGDKVKPDDTLKYTISYKNNGSATLTGVNIVDSITTYLTNISPGNNGKYDNGTITWQIGNINPNGSGYVQFNSRVVPKLTNGTPIPNNTAVFNSNQISTPILASPGTLTVLSPDFSSSFNTCTGTFIPGNTITYVINYINTGSLSATGVEIWDVVDDNLDVETVLNGGLYNQNNRTIKWNLGQVNINTPGSVSFKAKIKIPLANGTLIKNKATINADLMPDFVTNEVIGTVTATPDFRYSTKEVSPKDGIPLNKILTYTINYQNTGLMDAGDVVVIDRLNPYLSVATLTSYAEVISGPGTVNLKVDNGWVQFDNGTVNGNITIVTSDGTYTTAINVYTQVQGLIDSINSNLTAKVNIFYDSNTDRFTLQSKNGCLIKLEESGTNPFFTAIKIPTGIYCSGKYENGAISWDIGKVAVGASGSVTFKAMVIGTPTQVSNRGTISFFGTFSITNEVSNTIDTTPPPIAPPPTEGGLIDLDADVDGTYIVYWQGWDDSESGIAMYELQESIDKVNWITVSDTIPGNIEYLGVTNREKGNNYYYRLRAMNGAGTWSAYSNSSDGIRIVDQLEIVNPATSTTITLSNSKENLQQANLESGQTVVQVPTGAFNGTVTFTIRKVSPPLTDLNKSSPIISAILSNSARELMALEEDYYGKGTQPIKSIIVTLPYSDSDTNNEDDDMAYRIYRLAGDHWERVPGNQTVDADKNLVTAYEVKQLSIFAVAAPTTHLRDVLVRPNPFKLRLGHKNVKFENLSGNKVSLWIYNIAGELVFNKDNITDSPYLWPIVNNMGDRVASGVYIYIITNESGEKITGKVAIIK
ncbi:MAG: PQQ-binding-like beta-propeller repeat protein [bacterium]